MRLYPDQFSFSVSATTRKKRPDEVFGEDYYFISQEDFQERIHHDEFVEWQEVYPGSKLFYGTLKSEIERIKSEGKTCLFEIGVVGGQNLKRAFGDRALSVMIVPKTIELLAANLKAREIGNTQTNIEERIAKAPSEIAQAHNFDLVLENTYRWEDFPAFVARISGRLGLPVSV